MLGKLLLFLLVCLSPGTIALAMPGQPPAAGKPLAEQELREIFIEVFKAHLPGRVADVAVNDFSCRPRTLAIPEGSLDYRIVGSVESDTPGKKNLIVEILVNSEKKGEVSMSGDLRFQGTVVLLSRNMFRRSILTASDIKTEFRDISMLGEDLVTNPDFAVGKKLKKTLRQGAILSAGLLENPQIIKRGDRVTIMAKSGGLQVTAPGEAKNGGALGDMVKVKNMMSRRVVQARVIDQGLVEVER